jgi:cytochrome c biogenesis protein CcmG, thiol:disulfide interchange protein DsbE
MLRRRALLLRAVRRRALPLIVALAGAGLIGLLIYGVTAQSPNRTLDELLARGKHPAAPDSGTLLPVLDGHGERALSALRGKVVVLNFWASWCEPCQIEAPLLQRFQASLLHHGATVLGVTYLDNTRDSNSFVRRFHLAYPNLRDNVGTFAHAYGTNQLPESFLIDRRGRIVALSRGEIQEPFLKHALTLAERS